LRTVKFQKRLRSCAELPAVALDEIGGILEANAGYKYLLCELSARRCLTTATWASVRSARTETDRKRRSKKKIVMANPLWAFRDIQGCGKR